MDTLTLNHLLPFKKAGIHKRKNLLPMEANLFPLTFTTFWAVLADDKLIIFFPENSL